MTRKFSTVAQSNRNKLVQPSPFRHRAAHILDQQVRHSGFTRRGVMVDGPEGQIISLRPHLTRLADADQLVATYRDWHVECVQLGRRVGESRLLTEDLPGLRFRAMSLSGAVLIRGTSPAGQATIQVDRGSIPGRHCNGQLLENDDVVVGLGATAFECVLGTESRSMNFAVPERVIMDAFTRRAPGMETLHPYARIHVAAACGRRVTRIRRLADAVFSHTDRLGGQCAPGFASSSMVDALISALLVPWHREGMATFRAPYYQRLPIVRRAEEFMRANLGVPIMLHDLCEAARASERAVGYAFHDVYGMGAKQYLKVLRLNQVRRELKAQPLEAASVVDIAQRYGLWHMGHFSTDYRRLFGETPQQTRGARRMNPKFVEQTMPPTVEQLADLLDPEGGRHDDRHVLGRPSTSRRGDA